MIDNILFKSFIGNICVCRFAEVFQNYCDKFTGDIEFIWAGPEVIIGWLIRSIEPKILAGSGIILEDTGIKFGGGGINALARPEVTFVGTSAGINDYYFWLSIGLIFASIDGVNC